MRGRSHLQAGSALALTLAGCGRSETAAVPPAAAPTPVTIEVEEPAADSTEVTEAPDAEAARPPPEFYKVGEVAKTDHYTFTVLGVEQCQVKYYFKPKPGNIKLGVDVQLESTTDVEVPVNPYYAKLVDSEGFAYSTTFGGCEPELRAVRVISGEKSRGWITFEVPAKARDLKLSYSPIIVGAERVEVKFELGR